MKKINSKKLLIFVMLMFMIGCVSFKTAHERFIDRMNLEMSLKQTVAQMDYDPEYPLGMYMADFHDLTTKEVRLDGFLVHHYAMPMLTGKYICHYHLVVDPKTTVVVDWGFDVELGDPKKTCGIGG